MATVIGDWRTDRSASNAPPLPICEEVKITGMSE
jgi:hypothetical protein